MTASSRHSFYDNLGLGTLLACVAGVVNAIGFVAFGGFVTHVSGNATRSAVEYSEGHFIIAGVFFLGILFFIAGAMTTTLLMRGHSIESPKAHYGFPLLLEAILIGFVALKGSTHIEVGKTHEISKLGDAWYINTLTFSMGLQNAIIRQTSGIIIRTTHMTGIVTDVGIALGRVLSHINSKIMNNPRAIFHRPQSAKLSSQLIQYCSSLYRRFHLERFFVNISLLLSFLAGAVLGTFGYLRVGFAVLAGPLLVLILLAIANLFALKQRATSPSQ